MLISSAVAVDLTDRCSRSFLVAPGSCGPETRYPLLDDLRRKAPRSPNTRLNLVLFRLATCCGLRVSEIASLRVSDLRVKMNRPHVRIRRGAAKGGRPRNVPLWWDAGTLADLAAWKKDKLAANPNAELPFVASLRDGRAGMRMSRHSATSAYASRLILQQLTDSGRSKHGEKAGCGWKSVQRNSCQPGI